ncbi:MULTISPECIES: RHS repeat-associated core domain-containing protein [Flavobacterium]|uniref:Insecticide toxin TcdB middle/N-terminal domain-containing protein n=1 Tax=Flavobacterium hankyongi TaxID=1176532 RepID=A0ABP8ZZV0_9FLAO|nr:RHS repeat-associated core domain-containing protein [Flavobacterium sp. N1846]
MKYRILSILFFFTTILFSQNYHDTQGKLEISNSGQAVYTLPIAMPPSANDVGPVINLVYSSGQMGGVAGQGWNINSISTIARMATRTDIDGFKDGVDFDDNDKLSLDGQRLILKSGTYWADGSTYETEIQSNTKIELKGSGTNIYFITTAPDGSRTWYGNYGGTNATDLTAYYIVRFEDTNGNYITYHYSNPFGKSLCISEIKFSANNNGVTPVNSILFNYKQAKRTEKAYIKGVLLEKVALLDNVEVKTSGQLFRKYQLTHIENSGYERVKQIQEFNGAGEPANPVVFDYDTTYTQNIETPTDYANNLNFNSITLSGDFDGDSRLDFATENKIYSKLFQGSTGAVTDIPFSIDKRTSLCVTTLNGTKLNQFHSISNIKENANSIAFEVYSKNPDYSPYLPGLSLNYIKEIPLNNTGTGTGDNSNCTFEPVYTKKSNEYLEGDFDGNGISEILITSKINEVKKTLFTTENECIQCKYEIDFNSHKLYRKPQYPYSQYPFESSNFTTECVNLRGTCQKVGYISLEDLFDFNGHQYVYKYYSNRASTGWNLQTNPPASLNSQTSTLTDYVIPIGGITLNATKKCYESYSDSGNNYYYLDLNQYSSEDLGSSGFSQLDVPNSTILEGKKYVMDFNGDGKSDILCVKTNGQYNLITFNKLNQSPWVNLEIIGNGTLNNYTDDKQILFGDYNGDGKTDIMMPHHNGNGCSQCDYWYIYYSNPKPTGGSFFEIEGHNIVEYWANTGDSYNTQTHLSNYYALDTNNDGKSDLVRVWRKYYKPDETINDHNTMWEVTTYVNNIGNTNVTGNKFTLDYTSPINHRSDNNWMPIPIVSSYRNNGLESDLVVVQNQDNTVTYVNFTKNVSQDILLKKVSSSGGNILDEITYKSMEPETNANFGQGAFSEFYSSSNSLDYPNVEVKRVIPIKLVSKITNTAVGVTKSQDFKYHGYMVNMNLGPIGFAKFARSAWYQNPTEKRIWSVTENDAIWRGATKRNYSQLVSTGNAFSFVTSGNPSGIINSTRNSFSYNTVNSVYNILLNTQITTDFITNVSNESSYTYDSNYFILTQSTTTNKLNGVTQGIVTTDNTFSNNPSGTGSTYFIGRPLTTKTTTVAYSDTSQSSTEFYYTNNLLTKTKKKGNTTSNKYLVEDYEYDFFGNIKKKTVSAEGYTGPVIAPRSTSFTYDSSGRFVETSTDVEGLTTTNNLFHPLYGIVLKSTNPFGLATTTEVDNWGKTKKITDYLGKSINYTYTKTSNEYTVTKTGDDGSSSITVSDALGRGIKTGVKNIDGLWSYKNVEYDFLGRIYKETEPYSTGGPTNWSTLTYTYDEYGRKLREVKGTTGIIKNYVYNGLTASVSDTFKTVSTTKNANGHIMSTTDNGGTITYTYYANGGLKTSNFEGTTISTKYDEWGNKIELNDPSAGLYKYEYYPTGEIYKEITPKGETVYNLDNTGKLQEKTISGDLTETKIVHTYDGTTKLLTSTDFYDVDGENIQYTYEYDQFNRIVKTTETNTNTAGYERQTTYDSFGRPDREYYKATYYANGKSSEKWIKNTYKNGSHWQILDDTSQKILWQTNTVNERGQLKEGLYGNDILVTNSYNELGFPTQKKHDLQGTTPVNVMTLNTTFDVVRGNLLNRYNSLFNKTDQFKYDALDRLTEWSDGPKLLFKYLFTTNNEGFTAFGTSGIVVTQESGRLKVNATNYGVGTEKVILTNASIGKTINVKGEFTRISGATNVSITIIETDPVTQDFYEVDGGTLANGNFEMEYTTQFYPNIKLRFNTGNGFINRKTNGTIVNQNSQSINQRPGDPIITPDPASVVFTLDNITITDMNPPGITQSYDNKGRITQSKIGSYNYTNTAKLYQNTSVFVTPEANTYYQAQPLQNVSYNAFKSPVSIAVDGIDALFFSYNAFNNRSALYYGSPDPDISRCLYKKFYSADGTMEIKYDKDTDITEFITYIGGDGYTAPIILKSDGNKKHYFYLHRDYQGSIIAITDEAAKIVEKRLFDPWGEIVKIQDGFNNNLDKLTVLDRGYTGHEHLQTIGLIHMNGRLYDPKLHRFLQPDNNIQDPYNTQNYNRYGYVLNNPLKYTDTSGESYELLTAVVVAAAVAVLSYTATAFFADVPFTAGGLVKSVLIASASAVITYGIGSATSTITNFYVRSGVQALAHGAFQGGMSSVQGGNFWQGFAAGSISSLAASAFSKGYSHDGVDASGQMINAKQVWSGAGQFADSTAGMVAFGTVMGGAGASISGGNFWQGAATGFTVSMFNHAMHDGDRNSMFDDDDLQQQGKEVTLKSLGISSRDSGETIINKIMSGMKPGDYASGDMFSFINSDVGDYIKTVTRVDANNFRITTKGVFTGAALKNNSTLTISKANISALKITGAYKISINGLTSIGRGQIYQNVWVNDNMRYMYDNNKWLQAKVK